MSQSHASAPARSSASDLRRAATQEQFLEVIGRDAAAARFQGQLHLEPLGTCTVPLGEALGRVLARTVVAAIDVPGFDRANVDGFAVRAADTYGATQAAPRMLRLNAEVLSPGVAPAHAVEPGTATPIATGGMLPRGADAVVMIENTELHERGAADAPQVDVRAAVHPGRFVAFAGSDVARGETVMRAGQLLSAREIGVLAALGLAELDVFRRPRVGVISTGDEIIAPGSPPRTGSVYDSNAAIIAATVRELGGETVMLGVVPDNEAALEQAVRAGLDCDMLILSGGTSKGAGDLSYRVVSRLGGPGIVAHGVALKPGKPICLAVSQGKPVVILPGFPTSAIFTFHEFVAPVLRAFSGLPAERRHSVEARLPMRLNSERGRTEYVLVSLIDSDAGLAAYPMGGGSGSVTTFSYADGFISVDQHTEMLEQDSRVAVQLLGRREPADLVVIGSHCVGLDYLLSELQGRGVSVKALHVGSSGGLSAARRGECDLGGIHLMDPDTGEYNRPYLREGLELVSGYGRMQGIVFRAGDPRFEGRTAEEAVHAAQDAACTMVNRNAGSGTRILIDRLLGGAQPDGYAVQAKSHNAVATAITQQRADWGVAIETVARDYGLGFIPLQEERYDFVVPAARLQRPPVQMFQALLEEPAIRRHLAELGFRI